MPDNIESHPIPDSEQPRATARPWGFWATIGWTILALLLGLVVQFAVMIGYLIGESVLGRTLNPADMMTNGLLLALATLASAPFIVGVIALVVYARHCPVREYLGLYWPAQRRSVAWAVVGVLVLIAASDGLTYLLGKPLVPPFMVKAYQTAGWLGLLFTAVVVAAPISEETLFRGFFFRGLAQSWAGPWTAVGLSTLLWALLHLGQYDYYQVGLIVAGGLYFGLIRLWTGSVNLTILLHMIMNFVATIETVIQVDWLGTGP
jgi:membrane protease YdiL (CAAX protease family)